MTHQQHNHPESATTALNEALVAKERFLKTGRLPLRYALSRGLSSLLFDPLRLLIEQMPGPLGFKLRQIFFKYKAGSFGRGVLTDRNVNIPRADNVFIGDFAYLGWGTEIHSPEGFVKIGKRCHIRGRILGHAGVEIGDYAGCSGTLLSITDTHQGGHRRGAMIPLEQRNLRRGKIVVGKDASIGENSIVMPGVVIGEGAVVAPFSLVVRNVAPWVVVSGVPAVKIADREPVVFADPD